LSQCSDERSRQDDHAPRGLGHGAPLGEHPVRTGLRALNRAAPDASPRLGVAHVPRGAARF